VGFLKSISMEKPDTKMTIEVSLHAVWNPLRYLSFASADTNIELTRATPSAAPI